MAKKKIHYAIRVGRKSNIIVRTWAECEKLVAGYSGAIYKGFCSREGAEKFLNGGRPAWDNSPKKIHQPSTDKTDKYGFHKPRYYRKNGVLHADYGTTFRVDDSIPLYDGVEPPWIEGCT